MSRRTPLITDRRLPDRLRQLLAAVPAAATDDALAVTHLRARHPEYQRKPITVVYALLAWARSVVATTVVAEDPVAIEAGDSLSSSSLPSFCSSSLPSSSLPHSSSSSLSSSALSPTSSCSSSTATSVSTPGVKRQRDDDSMSDAENADEVEILEVANLSNNSIRQLYQKNAQKNSSSSSSSPSHSAAPTLPATSSSSSSSSTLTPGKRKRARLLSSSPPPSQPSSSSSSSDGDSSWQPSFTLSHTGYADLGGIASILQDVRELIEYPLSHPELYTHLGVDPPRGVLLHGPPGSGKTALANAIAGELTQFGVKFLSISAPEIVSGMSGESEAKIRALFALARSSAPCLLFIDEIDAITPKRAEAQREMERRIVAQMLTAMDTLAPKKKRSSIEGEGQDKDTEREREREREEENEENGTSGMVLVIGATNRPDSLDPALRRAGRFDREIAVPIPDEKAREQILRVMSRGMRLAMSLNWRSIASAAVGYVGADLAALTREAAVIAVNRIFRAQPEIVGDVPSMTFNSSSSSPSSSLDPSSSPSSSLPSSCSSSSPVAILLSSDANDMSIKEEEANPSTDHSLSLSLPLPPLSRRARLENELEHRSTASLRLRAQSTRLSAEDMKDLFIEQGDFVSALSKVQPSSKREGFASVPDVSWSDIGALESLREELTMHVLQPIQNPQQFEALGMHVPAGVLLFGPPGCGKTLVAKAIANESGASFLSVKGPELLNAFVGQSERAVRRVFERARASAPCVIFFDELDALCPKRGSASESSHVSERVVNQLLTEMDGLEERKQVFVLAATNRPDMIDPAMLRPGRLEKLLYVPLPDANERRAIVDKLLARTPLEAVDRLAKAELVHKIAHSPRSARFSGADCAALVREATIIALREAQHASINVNNDSKTVLIVKVAWRHFDLALDRVLPSVSREAERRYAGMLTTLRRARATIEPANPTEKTE